MEPNEFYNDLRQQILVECDVRSEFAESQFVQHVADYLIDTGDIEEFTPCSFKQRGLKVDGYALLEDKGTLDIFIADYRDLEEPETITKTELGQIFRRAETFFEKLQEDSFKDAIETSLPVYDLNIASLMLPHK